MKESEGTRLKQARESLDEAQALLAENMDTGFILTNLYYAYYYPILALIYEGQVPSAMQSISLGLFDQQYIKTGLFKKKYGDAISRIFSVKPKCSGEKTLVDAEEVRQLSTLASAFICDVETYLEK